MWVADASWVIDGSWQVEVSIRLYMIWNADAVGPHLNLN